MHAAKDDGAIQEQHMNLSRLGCIDDNVCKVGAIHMFFGPDTKIADDIIPDLSKQPDKIDQAHALGKKLCERLRAFAQTT